MGFTWTRWGRTLAWLLTFFVTWNFLFREWSPDNVAAIFSWEQGGKTLLKSMFISLAVTIWQEPLPQKEEERES